MMHLESYLMEQSELVKIIAILKVAYPYHFKDMRKEDIYAMTSIYLKQFNEFNYIIMSNAINVLIKKCVYMPSIAEIYQECRKQEIKFYKKILELSGDVPEKKFLNDMLDWYQIQDGVPDDIKNQIMNYYQKIKNKEILLLENGGK